VTPQPKWEWHARVALAAYIVIALAYLLGGLKLGTPVFATFVALWAGSIALFGVYVLLQILFWTPRCQRCNRPCNLAQFGLVWYCPRCFNRKWRAP